MALARQSAGNRMTMLHEVDPKKVILDRIGDLADMEIMLNKVLVAGYIRPSKTKSGIILSDITQGEEKWQGKVGLVVAMGPIAFKDDEASKFHGQKVEIGDWVWLFPHEGRAVEVKGVQCRILNESGIMGKIPHPDYVW